MTTPLFLLRCVQIGLSLRDLDLLTIGMVNDMYAESRNDSYHNSHNSGAFVFPVLVQQSVVLGLYFNDFFCFFFLRPIDAVFARNRPAICNPNGVRSVRAKPPVFGQVELLSFAGLVTDGVSIMEFRAVAVVVM